MIYSFYKIYTFYNISIAVYNQMLSKINLHINRCGDKKFSCFSMLLTSLCTRVCGDDRFSLDKNTRFSSNKHDLNPIAKKVKIRCSFVASDSEAFLWLLNVEKRLIDRKRKSMLLRNKIDPTYRGVLFCLSAFYLIMIIFVFKAEQLSSKQLKSQ